VAFSLLYSLKHLTCYYSVSVIQLTVSCTCCKYGISLLCYSRTLFSVSLFVRDVDNQTAVIYGPFEAISRQRNKYQMQYMFSGQ